ncbi:MAG: saccharopine dehydrogenase NADP-binding domain-containing protein [Deferribacteres bacterium]|nr:saccharopine dehydrogenase NADP-binding domain-containing protein [candidate division KSB1 bacterium]MCB9503900.1 saccharopine dehydrogenase NADP-binding domain-containing protein [Deferribacteres bacterium]
MAKNWIIYGANGYTGTLIAQEAKSRGMQPILAGRSRERLQSLAKPLNLEYVACDLADKKKLQKLVGNSDLVLHCAGPFIHTCEPMLAACLEGKTHYLDITGEIPVFESVFSHDAEAKLKNIVLISGVGFDVVPTDCLAVYTSKKIKNPTDLHLAFSSNSTASRGTTKTIVEHLQFGVQARRNGRIVNIIAARGARRIPFADRDRNVLPISWGDVATAWRSTGIENITTYTSFPNRLINNYRWVEPITRSMFSLAPTRKIAQKWVEKNVSGPDDEKRERASAQVWCSVSNADGDTTQAWLQTCETYKFTAIAAVNAVESVLDGKLSGALTPAQAFGEDFVLQIPGSRIFEELDRL